jgi:hypothetical protein
MAAGGTLSFHAGTTSTPIALRARSTRLLRRLLRDLEVHFHEESRLPANVTMDSLVVYRPGISGTDIGGRSARDANHRGDDACRGKYSVPLVKRRAYPCGSLGMHLRARPIGALGRANRGMPRSDDLDNMELYRLRGRTDP